MQTTHGTVNSTVLVVGVSGLIGRASALAFRDAGYQVTGVSRGPGEFGTLPALERAIPGVNVVQADMGAREVANELCPTADVIVFAGGVSGVVESFREPVASLTGNGVPWLQTLVSCREGSRVVLVSSQLVYGPAGEAAFTEESPCSPRSPYALHRLMMEEQGRLYADRRKLGVVALRLGNVYGPVVDLDASRAHGLMAKMLRDLVRDGEIRLYGGGEQKVHMLHVDDLAAALLRADTRMPGFCVYNIGGQLLSIRHVAEAIHAGVGRGSIVKTPWPHGIRDAVARDVVLDDSAFRKLSGWRPRQQGRDAIRGIARQWGWSLGEP